MMRNPPWYFPMIQPRAHCRSHITSNARSPRDLRTYANQILEQRIERVNGIASVETSGGLKGKLM